MAACYESISRPIYLVFLCRNIWLNLRVQKLLVKIVHIYKALCVCVCRFECVLVGM